VFVLLLLFSSKETPAQGKLQWTVTFDGPPDIGSSDQIAIRFYTEQGIVFTPIGSGQFGRSGGAPVNTDYPRNGSAYLFGAFTDSLSVTSSSVSPFGVVAVDLSEWSTLYQTPLSVLFRGFKADGSIVTNIFVTDGVIDGAGPAVDFQTFYFDSQFVNLVRVEVPTIGWNLDNMIFSNAVPEPSVPALTFLGASLIGLRQFRRNARSRSH
jgi:hypothetical protein